MTSALSIEKLNVIYHGFSALKGVSFDVQSGESFGLVGEFDEPPSR